MRNLHIFEKSFKLILNLFNCRCYILCICCGHCLNPDGMLTTKSHISNHHRAGFSPDGFVYGFTVFLPRNCIQKVKESGISDNGDDEDRQINFSPASL